MKAYFKVEDTMQEVKVTVGYELGGHNPLSGSNSRRGYYVYVQPVTRDGISESFSLFDGFKVLLRGVSRRSKKAEQEVREEVKPLLREYATKLATQKGWRLTNDEPELKGEF